MSSFLYYECWIEYVGSEKGSCPALLELSLQTDSMMLDLIVFKGASSEAK